MKAINNFFIRHCFTKTNLASATFLFAFSIFCASSFAQSKSANSKFDFTDAQQTPIGNQNAANKTKSRDTTKNAVQKKLAPALSNKRRAKLMEFVNAHHPEIRPLLNSLRKSRSGHYQSAIMALDRDVRNLQALEKRSPERYKRSLEQWTVKSKIKLMAAKLAVEKTLKNRTSIEVELKTLIERQHELRLEQTEYDLVAARKRVERLESLKHNLVSKRDQTLEKQRIAITKNAERILAAQKKAAEAKRRARANKAEAESDKNNSKLPDAKNQQNDKVSRIRRFSKALSQDYFPSRSSSRLDRIRSRIGLTTFQLSGVKDFLIRSSSKLISISTTSKAMEPPRLTCLAS